MVVLGSGGITDIRVGEGDIRVEVGYIRAGEGDIRLG